jgi:hypothetical protein
VEPVKIGALAARILSISALLGVAWIAETSAGSRNPDAGPAPARYARDDDPEAPLVSRVRDFLALRERGEIEAARAFLAEDPRIWYEAREGPGAAWTLGGGAWSRWDTFFRSRSERRDWRQSGRAVSAVAVEQNDFYRLIERPPTPVKLVWWFDEAGKISGFMVRSMRDPRARDRLDEFQAWARANNPRELAYLMPGDRISPEGDRPQRWKAILTQWRAEAGLPAID